MNSSEIPYSRVLTQAKQSDDSVADFLRQELMYFWEDAYLAASGRPSEVILFTYGSFDYLYDTYQQPESYDPKSGIPPVEARLIAAVGLSKQKRAKRDDGRLRGLTVSPMLNTAGPWDRGHFIGHSIGGRVDGNEANVFVQMRSANRGRYRVLETYCSKRPGTLCFSRPVYIDTSAHPSQVEFGILKPDGDLWLEVVLNR